MPDPTPDDHYFEDDDEPEEIEDDWEMSCSLGRDGQCGNAGTEWCDFECPLRDSELFAGSAAWCKKHPDKA